MRLAVFAMLIPALGYTLMDICAWFAGGAPSTDRSCLRHRGCHLGEPGPRLHGRGAGRAGCHRHESLRGGAQRPDLLARAAVDPVLDLRRLLVVLFTKALRRAHGLGWVTSAVLGFIGLLVYQGVFVLFNR